VLKGRAAQELLSTYQAERHPVGMLASQQSLVGPAAALLTRGSDDKLLPAEKRVSLFSLIAGYRYRSQAVLSEDAVASEPAESELLEQPEQLSGQPGTRVPHLWLERGGQRISTLDLFDGRFVLLAGPAGAPWCAAAPGVAAALGIDLATYRLGADGDLRDLEDGWQAKLGVSPEGAVLVRPDGFVAWRTSRLDTLTAPPQTTLEQVLSQILCRSPNSIARGR
jgi:hypothetical protein